MAGYHSSLIHHWKAAGDIQRHAHALVTAAKGAHAAGLEKYARQFLLLAKEVLAKGSSPHQYLEKAHVEIQLGCVCD